MIEKAKGERGKGEGTDLWLLLSEFMRYDDSGLAFVWLSR
jgi:hypothetical protein